MYEFSFIYKVENGAIVNDNDFIKIVQQIQKVKVLKHSILKVFVSYFFSISFIIFVINNLGVQPAVILFRINSSNILNEMPIPRPILGFAKFDPM